MNAARTDPPLKRLARERAGDQCEYCLLPDGWGTAAMELDHVIALSHGGADAAGNVALACDACNRWKGPNLCTVDRATRKVVRLFDPRRQRWDSHFVLVGGRVEGRTATGRATARLLQMNDSDRAVARSVLYPPADENP